VTHVISFRVTHYVILNVILYDFYDVISVKLTFFLISFVECMQNDVQGDVMHDVKLSKVLLKVK